MTHHLVGMAEIAEMLGVSRQRVGQIVESYEDFPAPEVELTAGRVWSRTAVETWIAMHPERGPGRQDAESRRPSFFGKVSAGLFRRFTNRARDSIVKAQEEARLLKHDFIGTEHLLLGLIAVGEGIAYEILTGAGTSLDDARDEVRGIIGEGAEVPRGHIPFTPRAKKVLELSLREAKHLGHNYIGTEHVLLAIVREKDGVGYTVLTQRGLSVRKVRTLVADAFERRGIQSAGVTEAADPENVCSFCGKSRGDVDTLMAGPGEIRICNECARSALDIAEGDEGTDIAARVEALEHRLRELGND